MYTHYEGDLTANSAWPRTYDGVMVLSMGISAVYAVTPNGNDRA
jgi:hypothetical protein